MAFDVTVNGTSRAANTEAGSIRITWKLGARPYATMNLETLDGSYTPTIGHEVLVKPNGTDAVFGGSIDEYVRRNPAASAKIQYETSITGHEHRMDRHTVTAAAYGRHYFASNAISDVLTFLEDDPFQDGYAVGVRSTGTPPAPLSTATVYYVRDRTSTTCKLAATAGGSAINLTDDGTGTHHLIYYSGSVVKKVNAFYGGLESLTDGTISDGVAVEQYTWEWANPAGMLDDLAALSGYVWFINADKELSFVPRTAFSAPWSVNDNVRLDSDQLRYTREEYANQIHARIDERAFAATLVSKTGDGSRRIFWVATPIKDMIEITLNATPIEVGVLGESGSDWYYTPGDHWIVQDSGGTTLTGGDTLFITYRALGADACFAEDAAEQASRATVEGSSGIYSKVVQFDGIYSQDAGDNAAAAELAARKVVPVELRYRTYEAGLLPGQLQTVTLTAHGISAASYLIDEVVAEDIDNGKLLYTVRALSNTRLGDYLTVFRSFVGGGASRGATGGAASGGGGSGAGVVFHSATLTANATVSYTVSAAGTVLVLVVKQDSTGGWVATLDTGDFGEQPVLDTAADAVNSSAWYSDGTKWRRLTEIWQH